MRADVQKLAKQAIFSAHRGDEGQCAKRLREAEGIAAELAPLIAELPDLRHGSFSNCMEEARDAAAPACTTACQQRAC
jgi:predicted translin family RNA/ssDNA-binding protein